MIIERVFSEKVAEPQPGLWSNCLKVGNQVFLSGLVALNGDSVVAKGDSHGQAVYIFDAIRNYLTQAGGAMSDVVALNIFVTDMRVRPGVLDARRKFFTGDFPCSTLVAVSELIHPDLLVEINATAFLGAGQS